MPGLDGRTHPLHIVGRNAHELNVVQNHFCLPFDKHMYIIYQFSWVTQAYH